MARLNKLPSFTGSCDGICFYHMRGKFFLRTKSSLKAERVKTATEFHETMKHAALLARASKIASALYRTIPAKNKRLYPYRMLTGQVMQLLKSGMEEKNIAECLMNQLA